MQLLDVHNTMLNTTTRLAVEMVNPPPWEFSWSDSTPQKDRKELTADDILPNSSDGQELFSRAVKYTMRLLVEAFSSFASLASCIPTENVQAPQKAEIVPMKLLFKDEKHTDETIQILLQYIQDCALKGTPQVCRQYLIAPPIGSADGMQVYIHCRY